MDEILKRFDQFTGLIAKLAQEYGPDVINTVGFLLQLMAIGKIIAPVVAMIILVVVYKKIWHPYYVWNKTVAVPEAIASRHRDDEGHWPGVIISGIVMLILVVFNSGFIISNTFNPVYWGSALNPYIAIAAKVMGYL